MAYTTRTLYLSLLLFLLSCNSSKKQESKNRLTTPISICGVASFSPTYLKTLPKPKIINGLGKSHLAISTQNPEAQKWFDYGLNLLHNFEWFESYRAFLEVSRADSTAPMAYWGMLMAMRLSVTEETANEKSAALRQLQNLKARASKKEQVLIEACLQYMSGGISAAIPAFLQAHVAFPEDPEIAGFSGFMLRFGDAQQWQQGKFILEKALKLYPDHVGLQHYYIHLLEISPEFALALPYAKTIVELAPNSGHIQHMPGHIYFLQGEYQQAANTFKHADEVDRKYHQSNNVAFLDNENYLHNLHYWAVCLAEAGKKKEALKIAWRYANTLIEPARTRATGALMVAYEGQAMPALVHIRYGEWQEANNVIKGLLPKITNSNAKLFLEILADYCAGMNAVHKGQQTQVYLQNIAKKFEMFRNIATQTPNGPERNRLEKAVELLGVAAWEFQAWANSIESGSFDEQSFTQALQYETQIGYQEPPRLAYPVSESIGRLFLLRKDWKNARSSFQKALELRPKSPFALQGLAMIK